MEAIAERCAGIDIRQATVAVTVLVDPANQHTRKITHISYDHLRAPRAPRVAAVGARDTRRHGEHGYLIGNRSTRSWRTPTR
jgi:hypothetical protein